MGQAQTAQEEGGAPWYSTCRASLTQQVPNQGTTSRQVDALPPFNPEAVFESNRAGVESDGILSDGDEEDADGNPRGKRKGTRLVLARQRVFSPHLQLKFSQAYRIERQIGEGSYGSVYEATALRSPHLKTPGAASTAASPRKPPAAADRPAAEERTMVGGDAAAGTPAPAAQYDEQKAARRQVAVKCFKLGKPQNKDEPLTPHSQEKHAREVASRRASFERERSILAQLEHPHIVRMFECFEEASALYIVMEVCKGGELYVRIVQKARDSRGSRGGFEEPTARMFFRQMLFATSYLHAHRIVHRDIKTENFLLLGEQGSPEGDMIKLCDFGTAVQLTETQPRAMERIGTLSYTAPEIYAKAGADTIADAWSLGVVLYVLLVGASPFRTTGNEPREETVRRIKAGAFDKARPAWKALSPASMDIVCRFLVVKESHRLTASEALRHRWVEPRNLVGDAEINANLPPELTGGKASPRVLLSPRSSRAESLSNYAPYAPSVVLLISRFTQLHEMEQLALLVCAQMLPEAELLSRGLPIPWYDLFFALDADEDGRLSFPEFALGLSFLLGGRSRSYQAQLQHLVRALDVDCSGSVDWIEWVAVALLSVPPEAMNPEPLCTAFRLLDRPSGDGIIGAADLLAVINTDATGACLSATAGRQRVLRLLQRWATPQATKKGLGYTAPPSLTIEDFQRLLEFRGGSKAAAEDADGQEWRFFESPQSPRCDGPVFEGPPETQATATWNPLGTAVLRNLLCRCYQPEGQISTSEEIVQADFTMLQQRSVLEQATRGQATRRSASAGASRQQQQPPASARSSSASPDSSRIAPDTARLGAGAVDNQAPDSARRSYSPQRDGVAS
eukprot:TRINITY_DN15618_c0_g1_i1.p1 TRINITY_DN15618_c0_g1~~TRINITY_DN15618_c0_g1_i1.p1  ORF type:complete len:852 (-),score=176.82 TRINITY_DN15618_c0_g1_i1:269-2824(-)